MWKQSSLIWSPAVDAIQTSAEQVTDQIGTVMDAGVNRLSSLKSDANYGRHPLSSEAHALLNLRAGLESLLVTGTVMTVSPYQHQIGTRLDSGCYLNPQTAVKALSAKLTDQADYHRPNGELHGVAFMVTASQLAEFAGLLNELVEVFPLPEWCQVARQATALSSNETDKYFQSSSIKQPRFKPQAKLNANPLRQALSYQGSQIATLESLADDSTNVIDKLSVLAAKRAQKLAQVQAKLNALKSLKGSVWSMMVNGTPHSISTQLAQATLPNNHQFTLASVMLSHQPITFYQQLLS